MGLVQSVEGLNRTKTDLPQARRKSASRLSSVFGIELQLFARSPASWSTLQILDLPSLYSLVSQFCTGKKKYIVFISCWFCFSGEPWLMHLVPTGWVCSPLIFWIFLPWHWSHCIITTDVYFCVPWDCEVLDGKWETECQEFLDLLLHIL